MHLLVSWLVLAFAVWLTAVILPGFKVNGFSGALVVAAVFGALNWLLGWVFFVAIGIGTLGLGFLLAFITRFIVDAILLKLTDAVTGSIQIKSFSTALFGALIMAAIGTLGEYILRHGAH